MTGPARDSPPLRTGEALSPYEARRVYDRIGRRQDSQAFYEDAAVNELVANAELPAARAVFEFGCGTGRFASTLLREHLGAEARYRGVDLSPTMVKLASERLAAFGPRAEVLLSEGEPPSQEPTAAYDRFVSNYVLDLLSEDMIDAVLREAHRILEPGGLLCVVSLSVGHTRMSRALARVWARIHRASPRLVGGCRPLELLRFIAEPAWSVRYLGHVAPFGVPSEVVVAAAMPPA